MKTKIEEPRMTVYITNGHIAIFAKGWSAYFRDHGAIKAEDILLEPNYSFGDYAGSWMILE